MKSSELADLVEDTLTQSSTMWQLTPNELQSVIALCRQGIMGPGKDQYERDGKQKFESMPLLSLITYVKEESRDLINYGVMVTWRMDQISLALEELSSRAVIQNLVGEGVIVGIVETDMSDLSALADYVDLLNSTLPKSDPPTS